MTSRSNRSKVSQPSHRGSSRRFRWWPHAMSRSCHASSSCSRSASARRARRRATRLASSRASIRFGFFSSLERSLVAAARAAASHHFSGCAGRHARASNAEGAPEKDGSRAAAGSGGAVSSFPSSSSPSAIPSEAPTLARALATAFAARRKDSCERTACLRNSKMGAPSSHPPAHRSACHPRAASRHSGEQNTSPHPRDARAHGVGSAGSVRASPSPGSAGAFATP